MKKRSCIRMDNLDSEQRKELNSRIKATVENYNKEIQGSQENSKEESEE